MAKVLEARSDSKDEWLPIVIIELRMAASACSRNGFPMAGNSGHASNCGLYPTFSFLLTFVSLEPYVRCDAQPNK